MTLIHQLTALESADLIRRAQTQPELEYLFRHALVQDAAYSSLLKNHRRTLHLAIGEALEQLFAERLDELAPVLGNHFYEADDHERALKYFTRAGDLAMQRYANAEAAMHYVRALDIAKETSADAPMLTHLFGALGRVLELSGRYAEALANYHAMEAQAHERGDRALELAALMARATIRSTPSAVFDPARGQALSEQALVLARQLTDRAAEAKNLWNLAMLNNSTSHFSEAIHCGEQALSIVRELDQPEQMAYILNDLSRSYMLAGQPDHALAVLEEVTEMWRVLGNMPMLADSLGSAAAFYFVRGDLERFVSLTDEAYQLNLKVGSLWGQSYSRMYLYFVYMERGEYAQAIDLMEDCIRTGEQAGFVPAQGVTRADLGWLYGSLGALEHGLELAQLGVAKIGQLLLLRPWALARLARLHIMANQLDEAAALIREAYAVVNPLDYIMIATPLVVLADSELALAKQDYAHALDLLDATIVRLRNLRVRFQLADALYLKGKALRGQGLMADARQIFMEARVEAAVFSSRRMAWPILASLSEIEAQDGNLAEAQALNQQAREIIAYLAAHTPAALRGSFLSMPEVRAVMTG